MNKDLLVEVLKQDDIDTKSPEDQEHLSLIMSLISEMNLVDFEPMLDEGLNSESSLNKYQTLAILRDLFIQFKEGGDTQILVELGTCGYYDCKRKTTIINLQGNNTGKNFAFALDKTETSIINFHTCYAFVDRNQAPKHVDGDMMMTAIKKKNEFKGGYTSDYDETTKNILLSVVRSFHDK